MTLKVRRSAPTMAMIVSHWGQPKPNNTRRLLERPPDGGYSPLLTGALAISARNWALPWVDFILSIRSSSAPPSTE